jgi:HlyD family secretion protein
VSAATSQPAPGGRLRRFGPLLLAAPLLALAAGCSGQRVELTGVVERTALELSPPVSEEIVALPHPVGALVAAGEAVVEMRSQVARLDLVATEALHAAAEANLAAAEREFGRVEGLVKSRVSTPKELDNARRARDEAVGLLAERAARVQQARDHLDDLTLRATRAGVVDQLPYEIGERVPAGAVVAVVLSDEAPWVRVWLPARTVSRLAPGAPAEVEVEGLDGTLHGTILDVGHESEFTPHYALTERERAHLVYESRIGLTDAPDGLRPGLPATVRIRLDRRPETGG